VTSKNWNCDGAHCTDPQGQTRVYPLGGGGNLILCRACFAHENEYRRRRCVAAKAPLWPTVDWSDARPYPESSQ
jgi:hypothetical protein